MSTIAHLTLSQYDTMIAAGVFDRGPRLRVEFIHGEIRDMTPIGAEHEVLVDRLARWSFRYLPEASGWVRIQNSIRLPDADSAPEPDVAWVAPGDYSRRRPQADEVLLLVEVAETSLAYDTGEKAELYAAAGIADYWVVDVAGRAVEVRRQPHAGRYRSLQTYTGDAEVRPLTLPEAVLRPKELFGTS